jgi:hypothetical protein
VVILLNAVIVFALVAQDEASSSAVPRSDSVRSALSKGGYPWYDANADRMKPVLPWPDSGALQPKRFTDWLGRTFGFLGDWWEAMNGWRLPVVGKLGDVVAIGLAVVLLAIVLVVLLELLRRYRPLADESAALAAIHAGSAQRIEGLPAGLPDAMADPWAEALRRRARGDYAGAVIYLFAYQLLTLNRLGQIRLVPGRTGRQFVRSVVDRQLRASVEPTLRLFEVVYYGGRSPSPEAFDSVWSEAEAFRRRVAGGVA